MDRRSFICIATGRLLVTVRPAKPQPTRRIYRIGVLAVAH